MRASDDEKTQAKGAEKAYHAYLEAIARKDEKTLGGLLAADYTFTDPGGKVHDRAALLKMVLAPSLEVLPYKVTEAKVRVYRAAAVVNSLYIERAVVKGEELSVEFRATVVLIRTKGNWQIVSEQATRVKR